MSERKTRRPARRTGKGTRGSSRTTSRKGVVGSKLGDTSTRLGGRALPPGGVREKGGLKLAEGARADTTIVGTTESRGFVGDVLRWTAIVSGGLVAVLLVVAIVLAVLSRTSAFLIQEVKTFDSEHLSAQDVSRLLTIEEGSTLLNVDEAAIQSSVQKNPWVDSVRIEREFPSTLRVVVVERTLGALVAMGSGNHAWLLSDEGIWIEPCVLQTTSKESFNDVALAQASELGVVLVSDVPASVSPVAGSKCTDATILAVQSLSSQLSPEFRESIVRFSVPSEDDISCMLSNGVEIAFGAVSGVETKEPVAQRLLTEFEGQLTYINVRVPSHPTYRRINSEYVREGTGATGKSLEEKGVVPKVRAYTAEGEEGATSSESSEAEATDDYYEESYTETATGAADDAAAGDAGYGETGYADESSYADESGSYDGSDYSGGYTEDSSSDEGGYYGESNGDSYGESTYGEDGYASDSSYDSY